MSEAAQSNAERDGSRRIIFIVVGIVTALILGGVLYLASRPPSSTSGPQRLEGALHAGSPEFEQHKQRIAVDAPEATEAERAIGDIQMVLRTTVRNFTGRTINGLEMRAAVVDVEGRPVKERIVIVIPARQPELEPNKTLTVPVLLEGFRKTDNRANIEMEVVGIRFKP